MSTGGIQDISLPFHHSRNLYVVRGGREMDIPGLVFIFVLAVLFCAIKSCEESSIRDLREEEGQEELRRDRRNELIVIRPYVELAPRSGPSAPMGDIESHPPPSSPIEELRDLDLPELMELYHKAFAQSKRQTVLMPSDVFRGNPTKQESKKEGKTSKDKNERPPPFDWSVVESIRDHADDPTIDAALQSARSIRRTDTTDDDSVIGSTSQHMEHQSTYVVHPESESLRFVGGICMICLEEMKVGDTVVWSETPSCPHMYHKDCLTSFLAHNCKEQGRLPPSRRNIGHDPCPVCRTNFVTVKWSIV